METEAELVMLEEPGRMLAGVSGGSGGPWVPLNQTSSLQNGEVLSVWYIITVTTESQHILWKKAGASVPLSRWQKFEEAAFILCCREGNGCGYRKAKVKVCFNPS